MNISTKILVAFGVVIWSVCILGLSASAQTAQPQNPQNGATGVQGKISSPPPTQAAVISIPRAGQTFTTQPVEVSGICPRDTLVKVFKNNVFAGSVECTNGSFRLSIDLFDGQNELIARVYDALDQAGPDSQIVSVNYDDNKPGLESRVSLTSNFAKRGANPGSELRWPIILSGGIGPYALSVEWGDGKKADLISQQFPGTLDIKHTYDSPGVYNIVVKATDKNGGVAYLQLVGVANGPLSQQNTSNADDQKDGQSTTKERKIILWQPAAILLPMIAAGFWLGKKHELSTLRRKIEQGDRPF